MILRFIIACGVMAALSGCSAISAVSSATAELDVLELRSPAQPAAARQRADHVIIELPTTTGALDTDRIMIRPNALQAQYLSDVRWGDPAPVMLQTLMVRSLESTNAFAYVGRRPLGAGGDFAVLTELLDFQAELDAGGETATIRLAMTARILREDDLAIVATRSLTATASAPSTAALDVALAFDVASAGLMTDFTQWTLSTLGNR